MTNRQFGLIGTSHIVALLDALGEWRPESAAETAEGFTPAFAGHHKDVNIGRIHLPNRTIHHQRIDVFASVHGNVSKGRLVTFDSKRKLQVSQFFHSHCEHLKQCPVIFSIIGGHELNDLKYVNNMGAFQISGLSEYKPGIPPIDQMYIEKLIHARFRPLLEGLTALRLICPSSRVYHIAQPPPAKSPELTKHHEGFGSLFEKHGLVDADVRLQVYRIQLQIMRAIVPSFCDGLIEPPPEVFDAGGFIRPELIEGLTHGNAQFGQAMWKEMLKVCEAT